MASRIEQLLEFVSEDPSDPFALYALALEYQKTDEQKAIAIFSQLIQDHTAYLATYYQLAKLYQQGGDSQKALEVYDMGIALASKNNDIKTLQELRAAKQELLSDDDLS